VDVATRLVDAVRTARGAGQKLAIAGTGSKRDWLPVQHGAQLLSVTEHSGIIDYQPTELVVTARCGTLLKDLALELAQCSQQLAFEPPHFYGAGTIGGAVSSGLSGPARPWAGSLRDAVLGVDMINGAGERLSFGGQVMKNVAGYDVSRLMAGAFGALGVVLAISLRVQPVADQTRTLSRTLGVAEALAVCRSIARQYLPVSATCWHRGELFIRVEGSESAIERAHQIIGGEIRRDDPQWDELRDHYHPFLVRSSLDAGSRTGQNLWRLVVPAASQLPDVPDNDLLMEWGGALRWVWHSDADWVKAYAQRVGGWAWQLGSPYPVPAAQRQLVTNVRRAFDPDGVFSSPVELDDAN
jgi:glycolate oxidase FAD binding subunit